MSKTKEFQLFKSLLDDSKKVLISTHVLPDGDGLGAETALFHYLKKTHKSCRVYNPDGLPKRYRFLDPSSEFIFSPEEPPSEPLWEKFDLWVIIDTNDPRRVGPLWNLLSPRAEKIVFLDHHADLLGIQAAEIPPHAFVVSDTESSSIGELLHHLFNEMPKYSLSPDVARGLYVSVMTDTNSFRYARTTPMAHQIAAEMIEIGVNPEEIYQHIFSSKEVSHLQLMGQLLQNVSVSQNGKLAWLELSLDQRQKHSASSDDTQSFLNLLLLLREAEIVCLFREEDDHRVRVSMKSKGRIVINQVAMKLGGGGHEYAAGLAVSAPLRQVVTSVVSELEKLL